MKKKPSLLNRRWGRINNFLKQQGIATTIRERFNFSLGNMQGSDVCPMRRVPLQKPS
jgi:hypothetical protein